MSALAARIAALEAQGAIAGLVHAYARAIRRNRCEDIPALFASDGWFEIRDGHPSRPEFGVRTRLEGRDGILSYLLAGRERPQPVPMIHNLMVDLDLAAGTARASSVMEASFPGSADRILGEYADSFAVAGGVWLFASRTYTIF